MQPLAPEQAASRPLDFLRRNWHWLFAAAAACLVLVRHVPAVYLSAINSDNTQIPLLFRDVVVEGHRSRDWMWGGHSDLFPDIALVFALEIILRDGLAALQAASGVFLAAYIAVLVALYRQNGGRSAGAYAAALLVFFVLLMVNFGIHDGMAFISASSFVVPMHTSIAIVALACFALCQRAALSGCARSPWLLAALCFTTALSNDLFLIIFTAPALAALVVMRVLYRERLRMFCKPAGIIFASSSAGHFLARRLSPFAIDPGSYTSFHATAAANSLRQFWDLCAPSNGGTFVAFAGLDLLFVIFVSGVLIATIRKRATDRMSPSLFMLLIFSACVVDCNWGASLLTGNFTDIEATRFVRLAMLLPIFHLLGFAIHNIPWTTMSNRIAVAALSFGIAACALFIKPAPSPYYREIQQIAPVVSSVMREEHIEAGLAGYWYANPLVFFSQGKLPVRSATSSGSMHHWVNTLEWYSGADASEAPPEFRLILMADLDPESIERRYGKPSRIVHTPPGKDIWIYPPGQSIVFNTIFSALSNGPKNEYTSEADELQSWRGAREGTSWVARAKSDRDGMFVHVSFPHVPAGRYRITLFHTYLSAPAADKPVRYRAAYFVYSASETLDEGDIPYIDKARHAFTREVDVPEKKHGTFQVSTEYRGSGDFAVDSVKIVYLGK